MSLLEKMMPLRVRAGIKAVKLAKDIVTNDGDESIVKTIEKKTAEAIVDTVIPDKEIQKEIGAAGKVVTEVAKGTSSVVSSVAVGTTKVVTGVAKGATGIFSSKQEDNQEGGDIEAQEQENNTDQTNSQVVETSESEKVDENTESEKTESSNTDIKTNSASDTSNNSSSQTKTNPEVGTIGDLSLKIEGDFISAKEWNTLISTVSSFSSTINKFNDTNEDYQNKAQEQLDAIAEQAQKDKDAQKDKEDAQQAVNEAQNQEIQRFQTDVKRILSTPNFSVQKNTWRFTNHSKSAAATTLQFSFAQEIKHAEAWIQSWHLEYANRDVVKEVGISLDLRYSGKSATVAVQAPYRDKSGYYDDPYSGEVTVVVFAEHDQGSFSEASPQSSPSEDQQQ